MAGSLPIPQKQLACTTKPTPQCPAPTQIVWRDPGAPVQFLLLALIGVMVFWMWMSFRIKFREMQERGEDR